jgi:hypothetical protein
LAAEALVIYALRVAACEEKIVQNSSAAKQNSFLSIVIVDIRAIRRYLT